MKAGDVVSIAGNVCIIHTGKDDNNLEQDIYIRYTSIGVKINAGDNVSQGQEIGDVDTGEADSGNTFAIGIFGDQNCTDNLTDNVDLLNNTFKGKKIIDDCNLTNAKSYSGGSTYSYCGLIFASKFETRTSSSNTSSTLNITPLQFKEKCGNISLRWGTAPNDAWILAVLRIINELLSNGCCKGTAATLAAVATCENMYYCIQGRPITENNNNISITENTTINDVAISWGISPRGHATLWAWLKDAARAAASTLGSVPSEDVLSDKVDSLSIQCKCIAEIANKGKSGQLGMYWNKTKEVAPVGFSQVQNGINEYMLSHEGDVDNGFLCWVAYYEHKGTVDGYAGNVGLTRAQTFYNAII